MSKGKKQRKAEKAARRKAQPTRSASPAAGLVSKILLMIVVTVVVAFPLGELVLRVVYGGKFGPRPAFYIGDATTGWRPAGNLDDTFYGPDFSIDVRTDADGHRLGAAGEIDYSKDLVLLSGDSFTFGWGVSTGETFASYFDEKLRADTGGNVQALNLGVGGYGIFQSCDRLERFLTAHPDARLRSLVLVHAANDVIDNIQSIGYHLGMWEVTTVESDRSRWHLVNFYRYFRQLMALRNAPPDPARKAADKSADAQDMLWSSRRIGNPQFPKIVPLPGDTLDWTHITQADMNARATLDKKSLSDIQKDCMVESIGCMHDLLAGRGVTVYHTFVYSTPDWYVDAVTRLIARARGVEDGNVVVLGRTPATGSYSGPTDNEHSGRHYNPEFSKFWAGEFLGIIKQQNAF